MLIYNRGFPGGSGVKNPPAMQETWEPQFDLWGGKIPWKRAWQPTSVLLPGKSHGQRSLVGKELDTTEQLYFHFLLYHTQKLT